MYGPENRKSQRAAEFVLNITHIVIGVIIVILAVLAFLNPAENMLLFPVIFLLAAVLNLINGVSRIRRSNREKKKKLSGALLILFGCGLLGLSIISALSIWWG